MESYNIIPALAKAASRLSPISLQDLFVSDPERVSRFTVSLPQIHIDFSRQKLDEQVLDLLCDFAKERGIADFLGQMAKGEIVNYSQNRAALHMAVRGEVDGVSSPSLSQKIQNQRTAIQTFASSLASGEIVGSDNRRISHIVHIGIGGSELGPRAVYTALKRSVRNSVKVRFVANIDPAEIDNALSDLNPASTLIVVVSKSFLTMETLANAKVARDWLVRHVGSQATKQQMFAVTNSRQQAIEFGIPKAHVFEMPDGVGGRFSLWSSVGLSLAAVLGEPVWQELLAGANAMDRHVLEARPRQNMPMLSALISFWNLNFLDLSARAIVPYSAQLSFLPMWVQQLLMESNGKQIKSDGYPAHFSASPIVIGEAGTNAQHAFFQALHQGKTPIPVDLIGVLRNRENNSSQHRQLLANLLGQASALMVGQSSDDPQKHFVGNRPSTTILMDDLSPFALGSLLAFYEHETVILAHLCGINPFDQWGVELGKKLATKIDGRLQGNLEPKLDAATEALLQIIQGKNRDE